MTFNGTDLLANSIDLKEGETLRNVQIVVAKGTGMLKGVVFGRRENTRQKCAVHSFRLTP
jgi:hypothetical protein